MRRRNRIMRQYPIWNNVQACVYKSSKSYGIKNEGKVSIKIGTSSKNSHDFLEHRTTHRELEDGSKEFRFYLDGIIVKKAIIKNGIMTQYNIKEK
jgi:hypothetical protein